MEPFTSNIKHVIKQAEAAQETHSGATPIEDRLRGYYVRVDAQLIDDTQRSVVLRRFKATQPCRNL